MHSDALLLSRRWRALVLALATALCAASAAAAQGQPAPAQNDSAMQLVVRFLDRAGWPDHARHYTGEMMQFADRPTLGYGMPADARITYRTVPSAARERVIAATITAGGRTDEWYLYLSHRPDGWKLGAVRRLALPPLFYMAMDSLAAQTQLPDSLAGMLAEMRLIASPDSTLKAHFAAHADAFAALARAADGIGPEQYVRGDGTSGGGFSLPVPLVESMKVLHVSIVQGDLAHPECVFLTIGGITDNEVGYLFATPRCTVPESSPGPFILVEQIAPQWYLYKTT